MIGQWCRIDKNKFCQERDCRECQLNYFDNVWIEDRPVWNKTDIGSVISRQANGSIVAPINTSPYLSY